VRNKAGATSLRFGLFLLVDKRAFAMVPRSAGMSWIAMSFAATAPGSGCRQRIVVGAGVMMRLIAAPS
jgi:hypothetical protein